MFVSVSLSVSAFVSVSVVVAVFVSVSVSAHLCTCALVSAHLCTCACMFDHFAIMKFGMDDKFDFGKIGCGLQFLGTLKQHNATKFINGVKIYVHGKKFVNVRGVEDRMSFRCTAEDCAAV